MTPIPLRKREDNAKYKKIKQKRAVSNLHLRQPFFIFINYNQPKKVLKIPNAQNKRSITGSTYVQ